MKKIRTDDNTRFKKVFSDEDFLNAFKECMKNATCTGAEVAEQVGCNPDFAVTRLNELAEKGDIQRVQRGRAWGYRA